jgi:Methylmalonyl-CoA mutase
MTEQGTVEGGLDEPEELEPEQGSLDLADAGDRHSQGDWEKAAAAVLRKARRMHDGDSDVEVWEQLEVRTLDGIPVSPLGTPELVDNLHTSGRPDRAGDWDIRAHISGPDAQARTSHRRAVPHDRQAAGRATAPVPDARAERGGRAAPDALHTGTSRPMMSKYDPWVNMLRTAVAAFAAAARSDVMDRCPAQVWPVG